MRGRNFNALGALSSHASNMITSIKNNSRRKELDHFKTTNNSYNTKIYFDKEATPEQLEKIRQKLKRDNQRALLIKLTFFTITGSILLYLLW